EIERTDIERRTDGNLRSALDQPFGEKRAGIAMIERAVDMRRGNRDEPCRAEEASAFRDDANRHCNAGAMLSGEDRALLRRKGKRHGRRSLRMVMDVGRSKPACAVRPVSRKPRRANVA